MVAKPDPYRILEIDPSVSDASLHAAYRRLVKLHHPDHHNGSAEATRHFQEIQDAYEQIREQRRHRPRPAAPRPQAADPKVERRLSDLEREVTAARAARDRAAKAARDAVREVHGEEPELPSDNEDSIGKILADAAAELRGRVGDNPAVRRVSDLIAGLDWLASTGDRPDGKPRR